MIVSRPAALLPPNPGFFLLFAAAELMLAMAVPFLAIKGYHTLLGSQAGVVVDEPAPGAPGWSALVEPTDVVGIAEVVDDRLTGLALVVVSDTGEASSVVLGSGQTVVGGRSLSEGDPIEAMERLAGDLRLRLASIELLDRAAWTEAFGSAVVTVDNPDPVFEADGTQLFDVGTLDVSGAEASRFLGLPSEGASLLSLSPRRDEFWSQVVEGGLVGSGPLVTLFPAPSGDTPTTDIGIFELPTEPAESPGEPLAIDSTGAEQLLRTLVPFPAGQDGADRLRVRIVDGHGQADLESLARRVAARGFEVVEISTAVTPSADPSQLIVPIELSSAVPGDSPNRTALDDLDDLAAELDVEQLITTRSDDQRTVSLVVGPDLDLVEVPAN